MFLGLGYLFFFIIWNLKDIGVFGVVYLYVIYVLRLGGGRKFCCEVFYYFVIFEGFWGGFYKFFSWREVLGLGGYVLKS